MPETSNQSGTKLEINQGRYHTLLSLTIEINFGKLINTNIVIRNGKKCPFLMTMI